MSIYIKGMEKPKNCDECPIKAWEDEWYVCPFSGVTTLSIGCQDNCPIGEVPPHGRLIDAEEFALIVQKWRYMYKRIAGETNDDDIFAMAVAIDEFLNSVSLTLEKMQTIIQGDKED